MKVTIIPAQPEHADDIAEVRTAAARALTARYGKGHWSSESTANGVRTAIRRDRVYVALDGARVVGAFQLGTRKPWAIDRAYFTPAARPLYLTGMAVHPDVQRHGIGRACVTAMREIAVAWPADAIWLDAYDAAAGAGGFYAACGFREVGRVVYKGNPLVYFEWRV